MSLGRSLPIYEFDALVEESPDFAGGDGVHQVSPEVFAWLERCCLRTTGEESCNWLRLTKRHGRRAVQVTSYVGVIRAPNGLQIEVLPKLGKSIDGGSDGARELLIEMLCCLPGFRHVQTENAKLLARRMPLLEVFVSEFLHSVQNIVKRGLRGDYSSLQDSLFSLRGKLLLASHIRQNLHRADRFFTEHDEFTKDRPENRLLHAALIRVLRLSSSQQNQRLARELGFVFADIPVSEVWGLDFQRIRLDRGMGHYNDALAWARLILDEASPLTGSGGHRAPSLLFPMEAVFEAFVARHLKGQLLPPFTLTIQARSHYLVSHVGQSWFALKPDLLVRHGKQNRIVLDTKWKLLDRSKANGSEKYGLTQSDFYQLYAYGRSYLGGDGDVALIYPKTSTFDKPLEVFEFPGSTGLRLWVVPFCLKSRELIFDAATPFSEAFSGLSQFQYAS
jgi:5-methylcytosine-specific restriction enzyme subunit McrC